MRIGRLAAVPVAVTIRRAQPYAWTRCTMDTAGKQAKGNGKGKKRV